MEEKKEEGKYRAEATPHQEECATATWLSGEIESLALKVGLQKESVSKLKEITEALAREVFLKGETCMQVKKEDKKALKDLCKEDGEKIISSAENPKTTPLVFDSEADSDRPTLYFRRQFLEETFIAEQVKEMMNEPEEEGLKDDERELCAAEVPFSVKGEQLNAVEHILRNRLSLISGGPGTGKTTLLFRALICVLKRIPDAKIVLAAPTGKAAARIGESMANQRETLKNSGRSVVEEDVLQKLAVMRPVTIHNMLGIGKDGKSRHDEELDADVIAIDEASMISQDLMAKVLHACPKNAKLILLGDGNQLDSVDPGRVFGDLCSAEGVEGVCVRLEDSHRIPKKSFLGKLANAVLEGRTDDAKDLLEGNTAEARELLKEAGESMKIFREEKEFEKEFDEAVGKIFPEGVWGKNAKSGAEELLNAIEDARILSPVRNGRFSVEWVNGKLREKFSKDCKKDRSGIFYNRLPILITQNDKSSGLNNGDVGVILENASGKFEAWFKNLVDEGKNLKPLPTSRLPAYETAYATTVHKAQGSEFSHLAVMLQKSESVEKICTRELLYTALTRHKAEERNPNRFLALFINLESLKKCVDTRTSSPSLLSARLKG